jgi:phage head maturation protease
MLTGYAVLFNTPSVGGVDGYPLCEVIDPDAFTESVTRGRSLKTGRPIFAVVNHGRRKNKLGDTKDGRLALWKTTRGVAFALDAALPADFVGVSFRMRIMKYRKDASLLARVLLADLWEVSLITRPYGVCYPATASTIQEC